MFLMYCLIVISHVKLQCCHGTFSYIVKMTSRFENVTDHARNLSLTISVANQNGILVSLENNFTCILLKINFPCIRNCLIFTRHHLITHANLLLSFSCCLDCTSQYPPRTFSAERGPTKPRYGNKRFTRNHERTTGESTVQTTLCRPATCMQNRNQIFKSNGNTKRKMKISKL